MNIFLRWSCRLAWRATGPIRRPLLREIETWLDRYVVRTTLAVSDKANITLDFASGELARIQGQIETMQRTVEDRSLSPRRSQKREPHAED